MDFSSGFNIRTSILDSNLGIAHHSVLLRCDLVAEVHDLESITHHPLR